ncbi:MAG: RluA family pseudouridine synthase [Deltaproteobacteria bacterium]|nr:RluA family pseudouridine synthase [Deltaproteobacteria bacterium]
MKRVLTVLPAEATRPLLNLLVTRLGLTADESVGRIEAGAVYVDGRREMDPQCVLQAGMRVIVRQPKEAPSETVQILHNDANVAVVVKPSGLPSIPPRCGGANLAAWVEQRYGPEARLLHRLDEGASGLLLVSVCASTREHFTKQVREHRLGRRYRVVVSPAPEEDQLFIDKPLVRRGPTSVVGQGPKAKAARTRVRVLERRGDRALLEVELETGRLHQIRAHLAWAGFPVLGDAHHGGAACFRLALHASHLDVEGLEGTRLEWVCPLPKGLWQ